MEAGGLIINNQIINQSSCSTPTLASTSWRQGGLIFNNQIIDQSSYWTPTLSSPSWRPGGSTVLLLICRNQAINIPAVHQLYLLHHGGGGLIVNSQIINQSSCSTPTLASTSWKPGGLIFNNQIINQSSCSTPSLASPSWRPSGLLLHYKYESMNK